MTNGSALLWKLVIPALCVGAGVAAGFVARGRMFQEGGRPAFTQVREDGYRLISPLLECDSDRDVLRNNELKPFKEKVEGLLRSRTQPDGVRTVALYFRELHDGPWFSLGEAERFTPASMRKVPMMIAVLKQAEREPELLSRAIAVSLKQDYTAYQNIKPSQLLEPGRTYTVTDLISRMIVMSDNNAYMLVSGLVDQQELAKAYGLLSMAGPSVPRQDIPFTVHTYASFFRILYNATYLSKEASDWALELLANAEFRSGIVAGVPKGTVVAHKFGESLDSATGESQLHDCGIVYYPRHPYLLCVMSKGTRFDLLDDAIAATSRLVYAEVDAQHRKEH